MKKIITIILLLIMGCSISNAQNKGIHFTVNLSWAQIQAKAKQENKYIFVDCFTTWCGPCKLMDQAVYPEEKVGNYLNAQFISVRAQMDTAKNDDAATKNGYADAHNLQQTYQVTAFPTFLFFSPDGKLVDRSTGAVAETAFIKLAEKALDPDKQFYTRFAAYKQGKMDYAKMPGLVKAANAIKENVMAQEIADDYIKNYLYKLNPEDLYKKENLEFIASNIQHSNEKGFNLFYHDGDKVDKILNVKGRSKNVVEYVVYKEDINPFFQIAQKQNTDPDWTVIKKTITKKFNAAYAQHIVFGAQVNWYDYQVKDKKPKPEGWHNHVLANIDFSELYQHGVDTSGVAWLSVGNFIEYFILPYSNDKKLLTNAVNWIDECMQVWPGVGFSYDYAGLFYRTGYVRQAIEWQRLTLQLLEYNALKYPGKKTFQENLSDNPFYQQQLEVFKKMKKGEHIWPLHDSAVSK